MSNNVNEQDAVSDRTTAAPLAAPPLSKHINKSRRRQRRRQQQQKARKNARYDGNSTKPTPKDSQPICPVYTHTINNAANNKTIRNVSPPAADDNDNGNHSSITSNKLSLNTGSIPNATPPSRPSKVLTKLQQRLQDKLQGGEFRRLNERLYTSTGSSSFQLLQSSPHLFAAYHAGYVKQVARWPTNPLDDVIAYLRTQRHDLVIADLGCGQARLCESVPQAGVHSFDLVAANDRVVACDIAKLPLRTDSVDVGVFCLSLMGTDYPRFVVEARRVLRKGKGLLLVAEVASRFENHDPAPFVEGVRKVGFRYLPDHPFVRTEMKMKKNKSAGRNQQSSSAQQQHGQSAFFFKFAFRHCNSNLDGETDGNGDGDSGDGNVVDDNRKRMNKSKRVSSHSLPALAACIYKKR